MKNIYINAFDNRPYRKSIIKGYAQALLGEILRNVSIKENHDDTPDDAMRRVVMHCLNNFKNSALSLENISVELHLSKYYISHIFTNKIKISFNDFINEMRIEEACRLLKSDSKLSATQIAYEVGFGSIRTFNRAFVKFKGISPREFKNRDRI